MKTVPDMTSRRKTFLKFALAFVLLLTIACAALWHRFQPDEQGRIVPLFASIDMAELRPFVRGIQSSQSIILLEGLPRQGWEGDLFASERSTKSTLKSRGFHFYSAPISVSPEDAASLLKLASESTTFIEWRGMKMCGGYHPDWIVKWTSPERSDYELHICFGCHEAKIYGTGKMVYCDIEPAALKEFRQILVRYQNQRPTTPRP